MDAILVFGIVLVAVSAKPNIIRSFPAYYQHHHHHHQLSATPRTANLLHRIKSQFHTQDELGQYTYGYNDGLSSKIESKTADGITQGSYAYVDPNGLIQNVNYISDDLNGFRVSASNLPIAQNYQFPVGQDVVTAHENPAQVINVIGTDGVELGMDAIYNKPNDESTPGAAAATTSKELATNGKLAENANKVVLTQKLQNITKKPTETGSILGGSALGSMSTMVAAGVMPATYAYQPFAQYSLYPHNFATIPSLTSYTYHNIAPASPVYTQFHSQDELGQYSYGYSGGPSSKVEVKTMDGITRGGYSYIDANGILQKVNYIADPLNGFEVSATNLPIPNIATAYYPAEYQLSELNLIAHHADNPKLID